MRLQVMTDEKTKERRSRVAPEQIAQTPASKLRSGQIVLLKRGEGPDYSFLKMAVKRVRITAPGEMKQAAQMRSSGYVEVETETGWRLSFFLLQSVPVMREPRDDGVSECCHCL